MSNQNKIVKTIRESSSSNQLICFPFVGGHWAVFKELGEMLKTDMEILAINPPGRMGDKSNLLDNVNDMSDLYLDVLKDKFKENTIFLGYSLGSIVSYDLLKKMQNINTNIVNKLHIVSASLPPHLIDISRKITQLSDQEFIAWLNMLGGIPKMLMDDKELLDFFTPVLKADYRAFEEYRSEVEKLDIDAYSIAGKDDFFSSPEKIEEWNPYYNKCENKIVNGGHMFMKDNTREYANVIDEICEQFFLKHKKQTRTMEYNIVNQ